MPISAVVADTPNYVLMDGNFRIRPKVVRLDAGIECSPIYGFSDKVPYDKFCTNSQQALKPYPLVTGYLRNQIDAPGDSLKLVVIDAAGPTEPYLHAATIEAVLEAQESCAAHVTAAYRLTFDKKANAYRVDEQCDVEKESFDETHA
jgi:hypothetical protein